MSLRKVETVSGPNGVANVYWDTEWEEYCIKVVGMPEECDCFECDLIAALGTADALVNPIKRYA